VAQRTFDTVAEGVAHRAFPEGDPLTGASEAHVLDIDLKTPGIALKIAAEGTVTTKGRTYGESYTVMEWCRRENALAGINGGFFGANDGFKKEVLGLLVSDGEILSSGRVVRSQTNPDRRFVRCVFGLKPDGTPRIGWAVGRRGRGALLTEYETPLNPTTQSYWTAGSAVACGPRLINGCKIQVSDRDERLVSPPALRRTFVGFDVENGKPRHLVLGIGSAMTFQDAAAFLQRYFRETHGTDCAEAMCLDGGSSTQLSYRIPTGFVDARPTGVTVPTAILVVPAHEASKTQDSR
jgi:exopolysaccharide biosynthesis protein